MQRAYPSTGLDRHQYSHPILPSCHLRQPECWRLYRKYWFMFINRCQTCTDRRRNPQILWPGERRAADTTSYDIIRLARRSGQPFLPSPPPKSWDAILYWPSDGHQGLVVWTQVRSPSTTSTPSLQISPFTRSSLLIVKLSNISPTHRLVRIPVCLVPPLPVS